MKDIPDKSIDMILCDLPYGTTACKWDSVIPFELLWEHYNRIIKDNAAIVLFANEPFASELRMSNIKNYKYDWIWLKNTVDGFLNAKCRPLKKTENIVVFSKKQARAGGDNMQYYPIPKSATKEKRMEINAGQCRPTKKPDLDNVVKVVADSLNGIAYKDDAQICFIIIVKHYGDVPRLEIQIEEL